MGHKKGASKRQESRQAKQGYARQGEAGRCRTMGGHRGAGGAGTGDTGARTICCVGGKERHRGENTSLHIHNPPLPTWVTTYIRIMITNVSRVQSKVVAHSRSVIQGPEAQGYARMISNHQDNGS